jgi:2-polyprenyl-3-methyl-5-hydroxy-6-metoxy-1,4-benzoquinol methylase
MNSAAMPYAHWRGLDIHTQAPRYRAICDAVGDNDSVLDVGCGDGVLLGRLRAQGYSGEYLGLERDPAAAAQCHARFGADSVVMSGEEAFTGTRRFDRIVLTEVLYYMPDPIGALRRCLGRLNPCGSIIATIYLRPGRPRVKTLLRSLFDWRIPRNGIHCAEMVSRAFPAADVHDVAERTARYRVWKITAQC